MAVVVGIALIVFGATGLWAVWQAHKGFWQQPRSPGHQQQPDCRQRSERR
jgi:hypothetical protein